MLDHSTSKPLSMAILLCVMLALPLLNVWLTSWHRYLRRQGLSLYARRAATTRPSGSEKSGQAGPKP